MKLEMDLYKSDFFFAIHTFQNMIEFQSDIHNLDLDWQSERGFVLLYLTDITWMVSSANIKCLSPVVIFGEDVAFGGVFRCTVGLRDKYGEYILMSACRSHEVNILICVSCVLALDGGTVALLPEALAHTCLSTAYLLKKMPTHSRE